MNPAPVTCAIYLLVQEPNSRTCLLIAAVSERADLVARVAIN